MSVIVEVLGEAVYLTTTEGKIFHDVIHRSNNQLNKERIIMKKRIVGIISMVALFVAYYIFRYPLLRVHGMKSFPLYLLIIGLVIIGATGIIGKNKLLPIITVIGYVVGFIIGVMFQCNYGKGLNNMWIIWLCCFVIFIVFGGIVQLVQHQRRQ